MAGDWIKMRTDLRTHPKVVRISSALKADTLKTIGGLLSVWSLFDTHSHDGQLEGYTTDLVDELIGWPGFAGQMKAVGWLDLASQDGIQTLAIPRFEVHNGASAKRRAMEADRKRTVRKMSASGADKPRTKSGLEERREEKINTPIVPQGGDTHASTASGSQSSAETPPPPQAKSEATASPKKRKGRAAGSPEAEAIYALYPRKKEPDTALRAIQKRLDSGIPAADLLEATRLFAEATSKWPRHDREYIPYPSSWFNAGSFKENPADWIRVDTEKQTTRPSFTTPETAREDATSRSLTATTPGSGPEGWQDAMDHLEGPGWHIGITGWLDLSGPQRQRVIQHLTPPAA